MADHTTRPTRAPSGTPTTNAITVIVVACPRITARRCAGAKPRALRTPSSTRRRRTVTIEGVARRDHAQQRQRRAGEEWELLHVDEAVDLGRGGRREDAH